MMNQKLLLGGAVLIALPLFVKADFGFPSLVIDLVSESHLAREILQTAQIVENTVRAADLMSRMARDVTHVWYWKRAGWDALHSTHVNLYGETSGWDGIYRGASLEPGWRNSTVPIRRDPGYTGGIGTAYSSSLATAEIADAAATDALASVSRYYGAKVNNDRAIQSLQSDFTSVGNDTYLGQAKIANGTQLQVLEGQQESLDNQANMLRLMTVLTKQVRDQAADAANFTADVHAQQGVALADPTDEFRRY